MLIKKILKKSRANIAVASLNLQDQENFNIFQPTKYLLKIPRFNLTPLTNSTRLPCNINSEPSNFTFEKKKIILEYIF